MRLIVNRPVWEQLLESTHNEARIRSPSRLVFIWHRKRPLVFWNIEPMDYSPIAARLSP